MKLTTIPNISVDCVIFGFNKNTLNVLLIERILQPLMNVPPLIDDWVITGYHIYKDETLDEAASRVLLKLTGLTNKYKKQFKTFGDPDRLMREKDLLWARYQEFEPRTVTVAYYFLIPTDEISTNNRTAKWFPIHELPELGFDHGKIIKEAHEDLKMKVISEPIVFELLPDKFTLNELQTIYESILDIQMDNRNFRKKILNKKYIIPLAEKKVGSSKKPSNLYMFSRDIYEKIYKNSYIINYK